MRFLPLCRRVLLILSGGFVFSTFLCLMLDEMASWGIPRVSAVVEAILNGF
jgi:hypothetical protein